MTINQDPQPDISAVGFFQKKGMLRMNLQQYHRHLKNRIIVISSALIFILAGWITKSYVIFGIGFVMINIYGYYLMFKDKKNARSRGTRIPERSFFIVGVLMGAAGVWAGMIHFHHKTAHLSFRIGIPVLLLINIITATFCFNFRLSG